METDLIRQRAIIVAREDYADPSDDDIEIDFDAATHIAEDGIWVAAWVWVHNERIQGDFPITLPGDPDHAAKQAECVARLTGRLP